MASNFLAGQDVGIVAYGETKIERRSGRTPYEFGAETFEEILTKAGLQRVTSMVSLRMLLIQSLQISITLLIYVTT